MIKIVGLGAGNLQLLTLEAYQTLKQAKELYLRTSVHPAVKDLEKKGIKFESFDYLYESSDNFSDIYQKIAKEIISLAKQNENEVVYAVPGHPLVAEDSVKKIIEQLSNQEYEIIAGPSFLDVLFTKLNLDPIDGFKVVDGLNFNTHDLNPKVATIISQVYNKTVASEIKLELMKVYSDKFKIKVLSRAGLPEEKIVEIPLYKLDRLDWIDHLTTVYLPPDQDNPTQFNKLVEVMEILRSDDGCPWDQKQNYSSLKKYLIEEAYEVIERIENKDYFGLAEELGDLLLHVVFLSQIANEEGYFSIYEVITEIVKKMIRRHPHVFGELEVETAQGVMKNWRKIKKEEKKNQADNSLLADIPQQLPALLQAQKVQSKAAQIGFDWPEIVGALDKLDEELAELKLEVDTGQLDKAQQELGDLLFAVVNVARFIDVDAETSLRDTINKFKTRFQFIEQQAKKNQEKLIDLSLEKMEQWWTEAKEL